MGNYVWYACYGSNLNEDRFNYYIKGGKYPVNGSNYSGCRDKTDFISKTNMTIKHGLYFAEKSDSWEGKAIAFITAKANFPKYILDKITSKYSSTTKCVLYKVTSEQFIDILTQENGKTPSKTNPMLLPENLKSINSGGELMIGREEENIWYGRLLRLKNHKDGCPIYTFTSKKSDNAIKTSLKEPGEKYLRVIGKGLLKNFELSKDEVAKYLYNLNGVLNSSSTKEKIVGLFQEKFEVTRTIKRNAPKGQFIAQLNENELRENGLVAGKSEVIISHNIKGTKHIFKTAVRIQEYPDPDQFDNEDDKELGNKTIALDQTIRDAIGCAKKNINLPKEYYTVSLLPQKQSKGFLKFSFYGFDKQLNIVRAFKATPNDMEINICRLSDATMQSIGIEDGDKIIVKSTTNMIHIRALMMSQKDATEYRTPEYLETDSKYERYKDFIKEKEYVKTERTNGQVEPKIEELAMIFIDLDARLELGIELGDPVTIYRSNKFAISKNIQSITIPLLLTFLGIGLNLKDIEVDWVEKNLAWISVAFYLFCSLLLIGINLLPIRNKFK